VQQPSRHRVVIVGGGFAGLNVAQGLANDDRFDVTLVDRHNYHLFQPLLYQVATGALAPGEIAQPLRSILRRARNTTVLLGEAVRLDAKLREVELSDGGPIRYDTLIVATGARHSYFGHPRWAKFAPGLKSIDDAVAIRRRILIAFEAAEREADPQRRQQWMTFVVVGAGPTGVELAGALGEIAHDTLRRDFRAINPPDARIVLVEMMPRVLPTYPQPMSASALRQLKKLGVQVQTKTRVVGITEEWVRVAPTDPAPGTAAKETRIPSRTVLWAAGVQATSFVGVVAHATGAPTDKAGRILVERDLTVPNHPEVLVLGDAAVQPGGPRGGPTPGVAQGGIQAGHYAAGLLKARLEGRTQPPFHYRNRGDVAVIGRLSGVTNIPWLGPFGRQSGFIAWALWLGIHITYLIGFANRAIVLTRWSWSFFTHGRGSRLITGQPLTPEIEKPEPPA
jgi:NADH:quinone reductase (non-electrogenic)